MREREKKKATINSSKKKMAPKESKCITVPGLLASLASISPYTSWLYSKYFLIHNDVNMFTGLIDLAV